MSLHIYIAHSGEHLLANPVSFASYVLLMLTQPETLLWSLPGRMLTLFLI